jgi:uncharacterized protein (TIGR02145 family)
MKILQLLLLSVIICVNLSGQGVTKNGQNSTSGSNFVNKHGKIVNVPALTIYGQELFLATVSTTQVTSTTNNSAISGGNITSDGGSTINSRGVCWNTSVNPTIANNKTTDGGGTGNFTSYLTGLAADTKYYVRAYAINSAGTAYGDELNFTTESNTGTFIDTRDGNSYNWVRIGDQIWMSENLAWLPAVSPRTGGSLIDEYYYVYNYNGTDVETAKSTANYLAFGVLYNWTAAMDSTASSNANPSGIQGACPTGWHLPSNAEWTVLKDYLFNNGYGYEGSGDDIAKSLASPNYWNTSATSGTPGNDPASNNSSGFTVLPAGDRTSGQIFSGLYLGGEFWSATESSSSNAYYMGVYSSNPSFLRLVSGKLYGYSVRCVKD